MARAKCRHIWSKTNLRDGFIVTEKCYHCKKDRVYFSYEDAPPKQEYKEGEHYWNYAGSAQSAKFDLECDKCGNTVTLEELMGLMHCVGCDASCHVNILSQICAGQNIWVYAALAYDLGDEIDLAVEKLAVLTSHFTSRLRTPGKKILVVPGSLRKSPDTCHGEMLRDVGMLSLTPET
jgi:hypothetical protein